MVIRTDYIEKMKPFINVKLVKIFSGVRRCGKSTILEMLKNELIAMGVDENHIITKKYSLLNYDSSFTNKMMLDELTNCIKDHSTYYFLLDELQEIDGWEKAINQLFEEYNTDIYVTGSNSRLMSSELSTYLSGRYVQIPIFTLSFKEYLKFKNDNTKTNKEHFQNYLRLGGFPLVVNNNFDDKTAYSIVEDIFNSVVINDISRRHNINNLDLFNRVIKFVIENVGKTFSANSIVNFLKAEKRTISSEQIYNYLEYLEKAFVIYRCKRYDLQGKNILKTQEKFYLSDQSFKYALYGFNPTSIAAMMENLVFLELKRRNYEVYIGKDGDKEIDFVAIKQDEKIYIQVCRTLPESSDREVSNLLNIKDNYPKFIITLDDYAFGNISGIKIINLVDFLIS